MNSVSGTFQTPTSTGNFSVTGLPFQPAAVIFFSTFSTSDGEMVSIYTGQGWMCSSGNQGCNTQFCADNGDVAVSHGRSVAHAVYCFSDYSGTAAYLASYVSMNSDGFTLNFTTVSASAYNVSYIAIGGSGLSVEIGTLSINGTGDFTVSTLSFQPDIVLALGRMTNSGTPSAPSLDNAEYSFGAATSSTNRYNISWNQRFAYNSDARNDKFLKQVAEEPGNTYISADLVSMNSDGFTVNNTTTGFLRTYNWLAIKFPNSTDVALGTFAQPTSTGNNSITSLSFKPGVVLMYSIGTASYSLVNVTANISHGIFSSSANRSATWIGGFDYSISYDGFSSSRFNSDKAIVLKTQNNSSGSTTLNAQADAVSMNSDGFTLNWDTVDATARNIIYVAFADEPLGGPWPFHFDNALSGGMRGMGL